MFVPSISHEGTNKIQKNIFVLLHPQFTDNSGLEKTDFRRNQDLNTNSYMRNVMMTGR